MGVTKGRHRPANKEAVFRNWAKGRASTDFEQHSQDQQREGIVRMVTAGGAPRLWNDSFDQHQPERRFVVAFSACLLALSLSCSDLKRLQLGGSCVLNSDCRETLVCKIGEVLAAPGLRTVDGRGKRPP